MSSRIGGSLRSPSGCGAIRLDPSHNVEDRAFAGAREGAVRLVLEGVDTFATVTLNGLKLGTTSSVFVTHSFGLPAGLLERGVNTLLVAIDAPKAEATARSERYPYEVPFSLYHNVWSEPSHRNFARKPQSDFGWDWGPSFMPSGLSGARLETSTSALEEIAISQTHLSNGLVDMTISAIASHAAPPSAMRLHIRLCFPTCASDKVALSLGASLGDVALWPPPESGSESGSESGGDSGGGHLSATLKGVEVEKWWPRGYGSQTLYQLEVSLCPASSHASDTAGCLRAHAEPRRRIRRRLVLLSY